jgi:two-component system CheB/CheR fusion protein
LPCATGEAQVSDLPATSAIEFPAKIRRRVLVVDDNVDARQSTAALLMLEGHDVRVADDGPSALKQVQDFQPDAVLLDIGLPGMNGFDVCRELRKMPGHADTLVIAVSGYGQVEDVGRGREAGVTQYLTKPADPELIARLLGAQA